VAVLHTLPAQLSHRPVNPPTPPCSKRAGHLSAVPHPLTELRTIQLSESAPSQEAPIPGRSNHRPRHLRQGQGENRYTTHRRVSPPGGSPAVNFIRRGTVSACLAAACSCLRLRSSCRARPSRALPPVRRPAPRRGDQGRASSAHRGHNPVRCPTRSHGHARADR